MSTMAPTQHFVIFALDYTDEGAINRRLAVRERHLGVAKENMKAGYLTSSFLLNQDLSCALRLSFCRYSCQWASSQSRIHLFSRCSQEDDWLDAGSSW